MKLTAILFCLLTLYQTACTTKSGIQKISFSTLLAEMSDPDALSHFPDPAFKSLHVSSWDRAEKNKDDKKNWFANKDYNYYIRLDSSHRRKEYVILDAKGPGAITRWWIPQEKLLANRIVRIYLDDDPSPAIEENYEDLINGGAFIKWPFAFTSSDEKDSVHQYDMPIGFPKQMGAELYLPIPFAKACKVTLDDSVFYYAIDYRLYQEGTEVETFSKDNMSRYAGLIDSTGKKLLSQAAPAIFAGEGRGTISKMQEISLELPGSSHAINTIYIKMDPANNKQMNRAAVLEIEVDGKQTVWAPVAEFFGGGVYGRPAKNAKLEVTADGWMISRWVMPYQKSAKVRLKNFGDEPISATLKVSVNPYEWDARSMYFNATWHEEAPLNTPPPKDWNYIEITGKGNYVGDVLTIHSIPKTWWGEGDEKIYINGEVFPSQLGTGLEDYYGFAWGIANYFNSPFISMPARDARGKEDWSGYNTVARLRLLDNIIFSGSLKVDMEAMNNEAGVSFSVCTFWYGMPNAITNITPDEKTILRELPGFTPVPLNKPPGEKYPDPPGNTVLIAHPNGNINFVGDLLDHLAWKDENVPGHLDFGGNKALGTAGYLLFGERILNMLGFQKNTASTLPVFIKAVSNLPITTDFHNAGLFIPEHNKEIHLTGLIQTTGDSAKNGLASFVIGENPPPAFRLGIMLDNGGTFNKVGNLLWVTGSRNQSSGKVTLAPSNRIPDWYFFECMNLKAGDTLTIRGSTAKITDTFSLGGVTFDIKK